MLALKTDITLKLDSNVAPSFSNLQETLITSPAAEGVLHGRKPTSLVPTRHRQLMNDDDRCREKPLGSTSLHSQSPSS